MIDSTEHPNHREPKPSAYLLFVDIKSQAYWQPLPEGMPNYIQAWHTSCKANRIPLERQWLLTAVGSALDDWMFQDWEDEISIGLEYYPREQVFDRLVVAMQREFADFDGDVSLVEIRDALRFAVKRVGDELEEEPRD